MKILEPDTKLPNIFVLNAVQGQVFENVTNGSIPSDLYGWLQPLNISVNEPLNNHLRKE